MSLVISSSFHMGRPNSRLFELKYAVDICLWTTLISSSESNFANVDLFFIISLFSTLYIVYYIQYTLSRESLWFMSFFSNFNKNVAKISHYWICFDNLAACFDFFWALRSAMFNLNLLTFSVKLEPSI